METKYHNKIIIFVIEISLYFHIVKKNKLYHFIDMKSWIFVLVAAVIAFFDDLQSCGSATIENEESRFIPSSIGNRNHVL